MDNYLTSDALKKVSGVLQELAPRVYAYLDAATEELKIRTLLMAMEQQEATEKLGQAGREQEKQEEGMMRAPFGYCPRCASKGVSRSKRYGTDTCSNGHRYPSNTAVLRFDKEPKEESHVNDN